jgi:hypothetical protein
LLDFNPGITYTFKIKSRNAFDYSVNYSNEVSILAASNPAKPALPTTTINSNYVDIDWVEPNNNGSPITGYKIFIRQDNLIYSIDETDCDGS